MKIEEIVDKGQATRIILSKIVEKESREKLEPFSISNPKGVYRINSDIDLNKKSYKINDELFVAIMTNLNSDAVITVLQFENNNYAYIVRNMEKILQEIEKLKISGIAIDKLNNEDADIQAENSEIIKPYICIKKGKGYLKTDKNKQGIFIGGKETRKVKLLQSLSEPYFGVHKNIETVFEAIKLPKDTTNASLNNSSQRRTEILSKIEWTKKELQKQLKGKLVLIFRFDDMKKMMWLELEG